MPARRLGKGDAKRRRVMIIFGTKSLTTTKGKGVFYCPQCRGEKGYRHRRVRRFFHLYWIPLIPLDLLGEFVECDDCRGTFKTEVKDFDYKKAIEYEATFRKVVRRVMVLMMMADGVIDDKEVQTICKLYHRLTGGLVTESGVREEITAAELEGSSLTGYLREQLGSLNDKDKKAIIAAAYLVAMADGEYHAKEQALIRDVGDVLELRPAALNAIISDLSPAKALPA
jgi:tellurite resistance protein